jgi:hypothetical protein
MVHDYSPSIDLYSYGKGNRAPDKFFEVDYFLK